MPEPSADTPQMQRWLQRLQAGDPAARDELLRATCTRLERLARKMLSGFPNVGRWAQTDDVVQGTLVRLFHALETLRPPSMRDFYSLAATQMRRELLDLARHFARANRHDLTHTLDSDSSSPEEAAEPSDAAELERWTHFHDEVEQLPVEEREVLSLIFYHGWKQADVADLFQVSVRTVQRRLDSALVKLHGRLRDLMPER
jgi:RNA polymerase sigma-70 factor (ECF subfamily)